MPIKIFIVDDDMDEIVFFNEAVLNRHPDVNLSFITNSEGFLSCLQSLKEEELPDIIISDLNMPKLNGYDLLLQVKAIEKYKLIPFIIFSTSTSAIDRAKCISAGAIDYIVKPDAISQYYHILEKIIKKFTKPE